MLVAEMRPTCTVMSLRSASVRRLDGSTKRNIRRGETPSIRVAIDFSQPFSGTQRYMLHCHNLEHEDMGMMLTGRHVSAQEGYELGFVTALAAEGARLAGMPWCGTMSFDTAGRTMMGVTSAQFVNQVEKLAYPPLAFGANCGVGASDLMRTILGFAATGTEVPIIAKGNAGIPKYHDGHIHYDGTPELMAEYAVLARDAAQSLRRWSARDVFGQPLLRIDDVRLGANVTGLRLAVTDPYEAPLAVREVASELGGGYFATEMNPQGVAAVLWGSGGRGRGGFFAWRIECQAA